MISDRSTSRRPPWEEEARFVKNLSRGHQELTDHGGAHPIATDLGGVHPSASPAAEFLADIVQCECTPVRWQRWPTGPGGHLDQVVNAKSHDQYLMTCEVDDIRWMWEHHKQGKIGESEKHSCWLYSSLVLLLRNKVRLNNDILIPTLLLALAFLIVICSKPEKIPKRESNCSGGSGE